jgi:hypothetical protein
VTPLDQDVAEALLKWYDTTHGNEFGHDHHCPVRDDPASPHMGRPDDACTCGWSGVLRAATARYLGEHPERVT